MQRLYLLTICKIAALREKVLFSETFYTRIKAKLSTVVQLLRVLPDLFVLRYLRLCFAFIFGLLYLLGGEKRNVTCYMEVND